MKEQINILVADRNSNIRNLLRRELESEGYQVKSAANGAELMIMVGRDDCLDLLLIDPDLPLGDGMAILERLNNRVPELPIIIHSAQSAYSRHPDLNFVKAFIEKGENLDLLKKTIADLIRSNQTRRTVPAEKGIQGNRPRTRGNNIRDRR